MNNDRHPLRAIFLVSFLFFAHLSVVMYINTTVLGHFVSAQYVSTFYILGAAGAMVLLFILPTIVQRYGLVKTAATIFALLTGCLLTLGTATQPQTFITVFMIYGALSGTVWYCNDLFVAHYSAHKKTGHTRGAYLTFNNIAVASMPVIAGFIVERKGFGSVYLVAASFLSLAVAVIIYSQRDFIDRQYTSPTIAAAWESIRQSPALRRVISINFLLQFFYVWMTLFAPLYLSTVLHFSWQTIGIIFSVMLSAFVIFQYMVGQLADRIGEKKLFLIGGTIATISTVAFSLLQYHTHSVIAYAAVLFCTRVGICMIEVLAETYFFKQITDRDEGIVSVYRMMYPLAYIIAPLAGWYIISITSYSTLFLSLGLLLFLGTLYMLRLVDIR
jgi:MFS family permease